MATKKNLQKDKRDLIARSIGDLEKVQNFIVEHATTYYARMVYNDITGHYGYVDEQSDVVIDMIIDKPWLLGIPSAKDRGLYHSMIILSPIIGLVYASFWAAVVTTIQDVREAHQYEIPVHARSVFSLVGWQGWVIFLATRLLLIAL